MASSSNIKFILDFIPQLADDKLLAIAKRVASVLNGIDGNKELFDVNGIKGDVDALQGLLDGVNLDGLTEEVSNLDRLLSDLDVNIDFAAFEAELKKLSDIDLAAFEGDIQSVFDQFNEQNAQKQVHGLSAAFRAAKEETEALLQEQKQALAAMKLAGQQGTDEYETLKKQVEETAKTVREFNGAVEDLDASPVKESGEGFADFFAKFSALSGAAGELAGFAEKGLESGNAMRLLAGQTGATGEELENLGGIADKVFLSKFSGSLTDAIKQTSSVKRALNNTFDAPELEQFTIKMAAFADVFEKDIAEAATKATPFIKKFGLDGRNAFDLIAYGEQQFLTGGDDFLDVLNEYSTQFNEAKFSAEEFVGVLERGKGDGSYNLDKLADATKESLIRITDRGGDVKAALAEITSAPEKLSGTINKALEDVKSGTISVKDVLQISAQAIQEAYDAGEISDVLKKQLEIAVGGTPLEDIGAGMFTKLFAAPIDNEALREKAAAAGEQVTKAVAPTKLEQFTRQLDLYFTRATEGIAPFVAQAGQAVDTISKIAPALALAKDIDVTKIAGQFKSLQQQAGGLAGQFGKLGPLLTNPWVLGTAAAAAALTIFFTQTERGKKIFEELKEKAVEVWEFFKPLVEASGEVLESVLVLIYEIGKVLFELILVQVELLWGSVTGGINLFLSLFGAIDGGGDAVGSLANGLSGIADFLTLIAGLLSDFTNGIQFGKEVYRAFLTQSSALTEAFAEFATTALNPVNWFDGDLSAAKEKLTAAFDSTIGSAVEEANEKIAAAKLGDNLANALSLKGKIDESQQQEIIKGIEGQSEAYSAVQKQQKELADQIVKDAADGKDISALKKKYDRVSDEVKSQAEKIRENAAKTVELNLDLSGAKITPEFQQEFKEELKKVEVAAREAKIGEAVTKAASIQGSLDGQGQVEKLVEKFKKASTDAEKNSLAVQIRKQMPDAVTETLKGVDANGELIRSFEVSTEKVQENVDANRARFSADLVQQQQAYRGEVEAEGNAYQQNLDKARALAAEVQEKRALGVDTKELENSLQRAREEVVSSREKVLSMGKEYEKLGLKSSDAIDDITKALGTTDDEAKDLLQTQKKFTDEAVKSKANVDALAEAFGKAKSAASDATSKGIAALSQLTLDLRQAQRDGDKTRAEEIQKQINAEVAATRAQVRTKKDLERTEAQISRLVGETVVQGKSAYEVAKERFAQTQKQQESEQRIAGIAYEQLLIEQDREKTSKDDLVQAQQKLRAIESQRAAYLETMSAFVRVNKETGAVEVTTKKKEYREEIQVEIEQFNQELSEQKNSIQSLSLKVTVDEREFKEAQAELERKKLDVEIELGLSSKSALVDILQEEADKAKESLEKSNAELLAFDESYASEKLRIQKELHVTEQEAEKILAASRQSLVRKNIELQEKEVDARQSVRQLSDEIYKGQLEDLRDRYADEIALVEKRQADEIAVLERFAVLQDAVLNRGNDRVLDTTIAGIDSEADRRIADLEELKQRELLTEQTFQERKAALDEEFRKRREEAEREHARQQLLIQETARGQQLSVQVEQDRERLAKLAEAKQAELDVAKKLAEGRGEDTEEGRAAKKIAKELEGIQKQLEEKGDILVVLSGELQGTITDTLSNLFAGDEEEAKKPFKKLMAVLAGVLERTASGVVTKLVLDQLALTPGGLLALLATPVISAAVNVGVGKIIRPVLDSLTSFASGGRVDSPTLAVVGDAARLGNDNREWILRDEHIGFIVQKTSSAMTAPLVSKLDNIERAIRNLDGRFYVLQDDLYGAQGQSQSGIGGRVR